eukprot:190891_1
MAAETSPTATTLKVKRRKLKKKKSFKEKLFSLSDRKSSSSKPKLQHGSSSANSSVPRGKHHLHNNVNIHLSQSSGSKLSIFIQETFDKLTNTPPNRSIRSVSSPNMTIDPMKLMRLSPSSHDMTPKSLWRPSLDMIYTDPLLLCALIAFQERSYNSESILFLQSVHHLNAQIDALIESEKEHKSDESEIDESIYDIFKLYLSRAADYQVSHLVLLFCVQLIQPMKHAQINVSSECFSNATAMCHPQFVSTCDTEDKRKIFDQAVSEIEHLMINSVLGLFYESREFQSIARNCKQSPTVSPLTKPSHAPIQLSLSQCTVSMETPAAVVSPISIEIETADHDEAFDNDVDELVFLDPDYFESLN